MALRIAVHAGAAADARARMARAARAVLEAHDIADAEFSIALLDDDAIADLHERCLGARGTTDVISFALHDEGEPPLGDVYIGREQALRQAVANGVPAAEELARLAVHGTLHVLGYDHPKGEDRERSRMWELQERIVGQVGAE